jgi:hypothetical protein
LGQVSSAFEPEPTGDDWVDGKGYSLPGGIEAVETLAEPGVQGVRKISQNRGCENP